MEKYNSYKILFIAIVFFLLGGYWGFNQKPSSFFVKTVSGKENMELVNDADFDIFWYAWRKLDSKFPDAKEISNQDKIYGAIKGLSSAYNDPYTQFLSPEELTALNDDLRGDLVGIGVEIDMKEGVPIVVAPLEGSPAEKAGVLSGDAILEVDGVSTKNMSIDQVIKRIRGEENTTVTIVVVNISGTESRTISIKRSLIKVPTIKTEIKDGVFVLRIYNFYDNSVSDFQKAIEKFKNSKLDKMVLDLRGNPGGYLESAVNIASWFIPEGEVVLREKFGKGKSENIYKSYGFGDKWNKKFKVAILVDFGSASASEILAGALSEQIGAKIFGESTYGKGSVQELISMSKDTALKITVAKWLTPKGISISETGLKPHFEIKDDIKTDSDEVLVEAIKFLDK